MVAEVIAIPYINVTICTLISKSQRRAGRVLESGSDALVVITFKMFS